MAALRVWVTADKRWRIEVRADGRWTLVERSIPRAGGRGGLDAAKVALAELPDAPGWETLVED